MQLGAKHQSLSWGEERNSLEDFATDGFNAIQKLHSESLFGGNTLSGGGGED